VNITLIKFSYFVLVIICLLQTINIFAVQIREKESISQIKVYVWSSNVDWPTHGLEMFQWLWCQAKEVLLEVV